MFFHTPKIIALCGHPKHGKSTVQSMLEELGVRPLDDGLPIRLEGMGRFGLTWEQVSTQEGKLEICHAFGRDMEVREALGLIGKEYEDTDPGHWAKRAVDLVLAEGDMTPVSFGSVRRTQGHVYAGFGGIVLEIRDPRKPESPYDFDQYDAAAVTHTIINDGTLEDLRAKVLAAVAEYLELSHG
ncbi:hypothetical protein ACQKOE_07845 [Novosphingobium sp. NPDC080210]|uniref:hypothetical protein n=1 Tax=Novosphingobium sp. NPDC080210 TaxID=3390596 RepID=UPI003D017DDC